MKEDTPVVRDKKVKRTKSQTDVVLLSSNGNLSTAQSSTSADCFVLEEEEAHRRTTEGDFQLFKKTCSEIKEHMKQILNLPRNKKNEIEAADHQLQASLLFLDLKQLNRLDKHRSKRIRDSVNEAKQKVDNFHLQLQNMLYEVMHLEKEVTKCLQFRSKDEEIDLVPTEEFYKEAPASISRPSETKGDEHQQTLARLEWELEQRKRLADKLHETENAKQTYLQEIDKKNDCLDNLQPTLRSIMEATQPLHQELGMPLQASQLKHRSAELLPRPLYVLYVQANAYREACDKKRLLVNVEGNAEEAKLLQTQAEDIEEESGDSDQEEVSKKNRHRRSVSEKKKGNSKILASHPLSVILQVKVKDLLVTVCFRYLIHLHIITATVTDLQFKSQGGILSSQVLQADSLLSCLFPKDDGKDSPNPANHFAIKNLGFSSFQACTAEVGFPFLWAQRLGGLEFLPTDPHPQQQFDWTTSCKKQHGLSATHVEMTITAIRERMMARAALHQQLLALEQSTINVPPEAMSKFTTKVCSRFKEWKLITWDQVQAHPCSREVIEMGIIDDLMSVYQLVFERGSAKLRALVLVSMDYPKTPPFCLLTLFWKGIRTGKTDGGIRELEELVNIHCPEQRQNESNLRLYLLSLQLRYLQQAFDVYLETDASSDSLEGPREFSPSWAFARPTKGKNRSRPFKYIQKLDIFT